MRAGTHPEAGRDRSRFTLWDGGFRPFFFGAATFAAVALPSSTAAMRGAFELPSAFDPLRWHQHELLFGYTAAAIGGFLLTAVPNWTGRLPLRGWRLGLLFLLWLAGRLAVAGSALIGPTAALVVDVAFLATLAGLTFREVLAGQNWRNLPIVGLLALYAIADLLTHLEAVAGVMSAEVGVRLGIAMVVLLIGTIGGRVVPSFTSNWLRKRGEAALPAPFGRYDSVTLGVTIAALSMWVAVPEEVVTGGLLLLAAVLLAVRLGRWRGWRTTAEPLVLILHVGYAWLPLGLGLLGLEGLLPGRWPLASVHALTAGAIGTMTLAIMTRATLGHTGRALTADPVTTAIYVAVTAGAALRVLSPALPFDYGATVMVAATLWGGAFALFVVTYSRLLARRP